MNRLICTLFALTLLVTSAGAVAQGGGFLEQLMRDLLESQRQRQQQQAQPPQVAVGGRAQPVAGSSRTGEVRGHLQAFSTEADQLSKLLRQEVRRNRAVAPYLVEMVRIDSRADLLSRKYDKPQPDQVILADLQEFDREWRDTAFRLGRIGGLSDGCRQSVSRLNDLCSAACAVFEVGPQLDRREVVRLADSLAAELHHLERDIEFEVRQPRKARQLLILIQRSEGLARLIGEAAHQGDPHEVVVDAFRRFRGEWRSYAPELVALNNRHIARTLSEVRDLNRALRAQLRLEAEIDRERLAALAELAQRRVAATCGSVSLAMLMDRPNAAEILAAAQRLDREAEALCECVTRSAPIDDLTEHWRSLHSSWQAFETLATPLAPARWSRGREEVVGCLDDLRGLIGIEQTFDRRAVTRCAAELASVAGEAEHRVALWRGRPGARVDAGLIREAKAVIADCRALHERCLGAATQAQLAAECEALARRWARLRPGLMACDTVDQRVLRRLSDDATTHLIRLQGLLGTPASI